MARTSRKKEIQAALSGNAGAAQAPKMANNSPAIWSAGGYARLSVFETRDREDSEALSNQKALLAGYIRERTDLRLQELYDDNGETGTNFDRSGFQRMMDDVRTGRINCIVVKDLSRFGRNYIETGNYLEHILPYLGVRFISINDGYDSISASSGDILKAALKNLVNQVYSMDISRKSGSVLREKQRRGEFIGAFASYGYLRDPADHHRMIVDEEAAPVVQEIFRRRAAGESYTALTRWLNAAGILSPGTYRYQKGIIKDERFAAGDKKWNIEVVKRILGSQVYLGHTVQGYRRSEFYAGRPERYIPSDQWVIVQNTHKPIISQELFDAVQAIGQQKKEAYQANLGKYDDLGTEENLFQGLVFCADCGKPLVRYKQVDRKKKVSYLYICPNYAVNLENSGCTYKSLHCSTLKEAVLRLLENEICLAADMERLLQMNNARKMPQLIAIDSEISQTQRALDRMADQRESMMRDFLSGRLEKDDLDRARKLHDEKRQELERRIQDLKKQRKAAERLVGRDNPWLRNLQDIGGQPVLTRKLVQLLVRRVTVYEKDRMEIELNYQDEKQALLNALRQGQEGQAV